MEIMSGFKQKAKRYSGQVINTLFGTDADDLPECFILTDVAHLVVELETSNCQVKYGVFDVPLRIAHANGSPFLRARYVHRSRTINVFGANDDSGENLLFSVNLPYERRYTLYAQAAATATSGHVNATNITGKVKHKSGHTVIRIHRSSNDDPVNDFHVFKVKEPTVSFMDIRSEGACCLSFLHWMGLTFDDSMFTFYHGERLIATVKPKIAVGVDQIGYKIKFMDVPSPAHLSKTIVLSCALMFLLKLGPTEANELKEEQ